MMSSHHPGDHEVYKSPEERRDDHITELAIHRLAEIFPLMDEDPFVDLKDDIAAHGLHEPIWLYEGEILDGRNRYWACRELGLDCPTRPYTGDDPLGFILSMNL